MPAFYALYAITGVAVFLCIVSVLHAFAFPCMGMPVHAGWAWWHGVKTEKTNNGVATGRRTGFARTGILLQQKTLLHVDMSVAPSFILLTPPYCLFILCLLARRRTGLTGLLMVVERDFRKEEENRTRHAISPTTSSHHACHACVLVSSSLIPVSVCVFSVCMCIHTMQLFLLTDYTTDCVYTDIILLFWDFSSLLICM